MNKLYKPVIVRKEVDDEHYYFVNGKFTPAVTRILDEAMPMPYALRHWIGEVGNEKAQAKLEKAGERGTLIHNACEQLLKGETLKLSEFTEASDKKAIVGFVNWANEAKPDVKNIEFTVASRLGYAGTLDIYCEINKEPWIVDIKTSANVYDSHKLQIAGYQNAFAEMTGIKANMGILHLNPRTIKGWTFHKDLEISGEPVDIRDFMAVFNMYLMLNGGGVKEPDLTDVYPDEIKLYQEENANQG